MGSALSLLMLAYRIGHSGTWHYLFLVWNLILAWLPMLLASGAHRLDKRGRSGLQIIICMGMWLLFFPNAVYIITDFVHLRQRDNMPLWYDLSLILSFAMNAYYIGLVSLYLMHDLVRRRRGATAGWTFVWATAVLSSFGVYLGRFLRWNSWDFLLQPGPLLTDIIQIVLNPRENPGASGMTIIFTMILIISYVMVFSLTRINPPADGRSAP